ncbi:TetR/AcrR family transcriptional regulator [Neorhizobium galegae]|uniref:TetR/AcrR family transcriptional regulator n=1 Tax=Neorhizobium galegae TaxID=399 RepID=UPI000621F557|nr:TetR/AcrR family transcriptional regulator [Neorhizobium galegae]MCQ1764562.1 TetR/AcrR family transcriptional regulator [Neorhizobium galegae]MCQ1847676.1 TetR/AcrR family transcriptional regulator [Neorhizobium galegae]CDZ43159.1 Transcriptional regulator, repressor protein MphR(A) [Neorhizobium galegae bv. officinalis]
MARPKTMPDRNVLAAALKVMHEKGPEALTFASLAAACGLSASTLVQRFKNKEELARAALLFAWDDLDAKTEAAITAAPRTPEGAVDILVALSGDYGGIEAYAEGLLMLREDFRDPRLRARGSAWGAVISTAITACFAATRGTPDNIGMLMASQWQGCLLWWGFNPAGPIDAHVRRSLEEFVAAVLPRK